MRRTADVRLRLAAIISAFALAFSAMPAALADEVVVDEPVAIVDASEQNEEEPEGEEPEGQPIEMVAPEQGDSETEEGEAEVPEAVADDPEEESPVAIEAPLESDDAEPDAGEVPEDLDAPDVVPGLSPQDYGSDMATATSIDPGGMVSSVLISSNDENWYVFTLDKPGKVVIRFECSYLDSTSAWNVALYNPSNKHIYGGQYKANTGKTATLMTTGLAAGTYYIRVSNYNYGTALVGHYYELYLDYTASSVWEAELNDNMATADPITFGKTYYGTMYHSERSDQDYYTFTLSKTTTVQIAFESSYADTNQAWGIQLRNENDSNISTGSYYTTTGSKKTLITESLPAGTYYVRVNEYTYGTSIQGLTYKLTVNTQQTSKSIKASSITVSSVGSKTYTGSPIKPSVTVKDGSKTLKAGTDYTLSYKNNTNPGTATITITGKGSYTGTRTVTFKIAQPFKYVNSSTPHYADILWLYAKGITTGYGSGSNRTFSPYTNVARCDMAAFLYRLAGSPSYTPSALERSYFADVDSSTPHAKEIWWLASKGISTGWTERNGTHTFRPYESVTRADMAAFLYRMAGSPSFTPTSAQKKYFNDVTSTTPHAREIWWLASKGVSTGWENSNGTHSFRPYENVARADMAAFLHRMSSKKLVAKL